MADIKEQGAESYDWGEGVYLIGRTDPVEGGEEGTSNRQGKALALRTRNLHQRTAALEKALPEGDAATLRTANDYADKAVAALVNGSPEALDTLRELAAALGDDPNFAATVMQMIGEKLPTATFDAFRDKAWTEDNISPLPQYYKNAVSNLDSIRAPGIYYFTPTAEHNPTSNYGLLIVHWGYEGNWVFQTACSVAGETYTRTDTSNRWSSWIRQWNTGNFDPAAKADAEGDKTKTFKAACIDYSDPVKGDGMYVGRGVDISSGFSNGDLVMGSFGGGRAILAGEQPYYVPTGSIHTRHDIWHAGNFAPSTKIDKPSSPWYGIGMGTCSLINTSDAGVLQWQHKRPDGVYVDDIVYHSGNFDPAAKADAPTVFYGNTHMNYFQKPGFYTFDGPSIGNTPPILSANWRLLVMGASNRCTQIASSWDADRLYFRRQIAGGAWTTWQELYHTGNLAAATPATDGLMPAADKAKLDGVEAGANHYAHPAMHPASMIETDQDRMFASLTEKNYWSAKASTDTATMLADGLMSDSDKRKLDGVDYAANCYSHPDTHPASMIATDSSRQFASSSEKAGWNAKASTALATPSAHGLMSATDKGRVNDAPKVFAAGQVSWDGRLTLYKGSVDVSVSGGAYTIALKTTIPVYTVLLTPLDADRIVYIASKSSTSFTVHATTLANSGSSSGFEFCIMTY